MRYLLDTNILIWWLNDDKNLSQTARKIIKDPRNTIFISSVSTWEITLKESKNKIIIPNNLHQTLTDSNFIQLPINIKHTFEISKLKPIHQDPFDRLLLAQAKLENLTLLTHDKLLTKYKDIKVKEA